MAWGSVTHMNEGFVFWEVNTDVERGVHARPESLTAFFRPITSQFIHSADSLLDSFPDDWDTEPDQR
jgi:hypothetical protein